MSLQSMEATQIGVNGRSVKTRVGDPSSTGPEHVLTLPLLMTGSRALEMHSKPSWNVPYHAQVRFLNPKLLK